MKTYTIKVTLRDELEKSLSQISPLPESGEFEIDSSNKVNSVEEACLKAMFVSALTKYLIGLEKLKIKNQILNN